MNFKGRDIISIRDLKKDEINYILDVAQKSGHGYEDIAKGKILATLFFEPSTRTRLSFEAAMHKIGGSVIGFSDSVNTSVVKGESLRDTLKIVDGYADVIVIRHPQAGSAKEAADVCSVPVINGGDGANEHPTQTLVDLYTIRDVFGKIDDVNIAFVGDLKFGRTVHSLAYALSLFKTKMNFVSPDSLRMPEKYVHELRSKSISVIETTLLDDVIKDIDVLYVTRIQKERFMNPAEYNKVRGYYKLSKDILKKANPALKILHPLPRVDELNLDLDEAEQSIYFKQAHNGIPIRKALLGLLLGLKK